MGKKALFGTIKTIGVHNISAHQWFNSSHLNQVEGFEFLERNISSCLLSSRKGREQNQTRVAALSQGYTQDIFKA